MPADTLIATADLTVHGLDDDPFDRGVYLSGCRTVSTLPPALQAHVHGAVEHVRATSTHGWTLRLATTTIPNPVRAEPDRVAHVGVIAITDPDGHREIVISRTGRPFNGNPVAPLVSGYGFGAITTNWSTRQPLSGEDLAELSTYQDRQWRHVQRIHALARAVTSSTPEPGTPFWQTPDAIDWYRFPDNPSAEPWLDLFEYDADRAFDYHRHGFTPQQAHAWIGANIKVGPDGARALADAGWTPHLAGEYFTAVRAHVPVLRDGAEAAQRHHTHLHRWTEIAKVSGIAPHHLVAAAQAHLSIWELAGTETEQQWATVHLMAALRAAG